MERKDKLKKLNELKKSILAISLSSTVVLSASACSNQNEPYFSETLSMEDYFESHDESNCIAVNYIDNTMLDGKTFEEWKDIYNEVRSHAIYDEKKVMYKPTSENSEICLNRALYSMGLLVLKGQIIETLGVQPENVDEIKVIGASKDNDNMVQVAYRTYETKKATGNINTIVTTNKNESYDLKNMGKELVDIIIKAGDQKISSTNNLNDYDEAYQKICEFMLCKGTINDSLFSGKSIDFSFDPVKVLNFNEKNDPNLQKTMVKTTDPVK